MHAAHERWLAAPLGRRRFLAGLGAAGLSAGLPAGRAGLLPFVRSLPASALDRLFEPAGDGPRFLTPHQYDVVVEATARLIPGPADDPAETTPGAREAGVARYVDGLLSAFDGDPPRVFAGGPTSDRHGARRNAMADWVAMPDWQTELWRHRIADLRGRYHDGVTALDRTAGGDFTTVSIERRDEILAADGPGGFRRLLFEHSVEAMYAVPEYGGNLDERGWETIGFAGDVAPRGWTRTEVSEGDGPDPVPDGFALPFPAQVIEHIDTGDDATVVP